MLFSIVIATHKRAALLEECLASVKQQNFTDYEVIIAHSGADQETLDLIHAIADPAIHYLKCREKGAASQRNEGVAAAQGEWVVFLDDDVVLRKYFLTEMEEAITTHPEAGGISGRIENQYFEQPSRVTKQFLTWVGVDVSKPLSGKVVGPVINYLPEKEGATYEQLDWMPSCICAYRKNLFVEVGGFPEQFKNYSFAEDVYISTRIAREAPLVLNRKAVLYHYDTGSQNHPDFYAVARTQVENKFYISKHNLGDGSLRQLQRIRKWYWLNALTLFLKKKYSFHDFRQCLKGYNESYKVLKEEING